MSENKGELRAVANGGLGLHLSYRIDATQFRDDGNLALYGVDRTGRDFIVLGVETSPGEYVLLRRKQKPGVGEWPWPADYRVEVGKASLAHNADGSSSLELRDFTPEMDAQVSPMPPPISQTFVFGLVLGA